MSHDRCIKKVEEFIGHDRDGNEVYEVTRYFEELIPETHRYVIPKVKNKKENGENGKN